MGLSVALIVDNPKEWTLNVYIFSENCRNGGVFLKEWYAPENLGLLPKT